MHVESVCGLWTALWAVDKWSLRCNMHVAGKLQSVGIARPAVMRL